ncbi:MAG: 30S ribosomal protein S9 [Spiroplasma sp.]|nr:30S ribosomal protein S9 [Spiroplasma sp.]
MTNKITTYSSSGGRKSSIARVHMTNTNNQGSVLVNGIEPMKFFTQELLVKDMLLPLNVTNTLTKFDVRINVDGGGKSGQAGAARLAIAKTLIKVSKEYKDLLRDNGLLTRDARIKERKKYGLKAARKAPQFSKR